MAQRVKSWGRKIIVRNRAVKWWDGKVKEATRVRREAHARFIPSQTMIGWEECTKSRKGVKRVVKKKKRGVREDVVKKTNDALFGWRDKTNVGKERRELENR